MQIARVFGHFYILSLNCDGTLRQFTLWNYDTTIDIYYYFNKITGS